MSKFGDKAIKRFNRILLRALGVNIGRNTKFFISYKKFGERPYLVKIGNNCAVSAGVKFITSDNGLKDIKNQHFKKNNKIEIKDNCFIGMNAVLYPGVIIGENSIVGARAVVTKSVPPNTCVMGNPARVSCTLDTYIDICEKSIIKGYIPKNKKQFLIDNFWGISN